MTKIVSKKHALSLAASELIERELPILKSVYHSENELDLDVADWLSYYINHPDGTSVYHVDADTASNVTAQMTEYYHFMLAGLRLLFARPNSEVLKYFPCEMIQKHGDKFLEYARTEFARQGAVKNTLGGRFDAAMNPETGEIEGIYEFNGDTPVMLFESVNLQNLISSQITGTEETQQNDWWPTQVENFQHLAGKNVAVICDVTYIEDATTCETVAQMFEAVGAHAFFADLKHLGYDPMNLTVPFYIEGSAHIPDVIFILHPWEEMVMHSPEIIGNHRYWGAHTKFLEPSWRWFMSHKGFMVFLTDLLKTTAGNTRWGHIKHLSTSFSPDQFNGTYVSKPVHGRLSQNIKVVVDGVAKFETGGSYPDIPVVYQEYCPPFKLGDGRNFIVGGWVSGGDMDHLTQVTTICFREFDGGVLELTNERFIAHVTE